MKVWLRVKCLIKELSPFIILFPLPILFSYVAYFNVVTPSPGGTEMTVCVALGFGLALGYMNLFATGIFFLGLDSENIARDPLRKLPAGILFLALELTALIVYLAAVYEVTMAIKAPIIVGTLTLFSSLFAYNFFAEASNYQPEEECEAGC